MKKLTLKLMVICIGIILGVSMTTSVFATNEDVQILKESDTEYIIYISEHMNTSFEFAFSNDKNANKDELIYKVSATDTVEKDANHIAYIDNDLYTKFFGQTTYLWAKTLSGEYFAEAIELDLSNVVEQKEIDLVNNITKIIKVDTTNTVTTTEIQNDVKITKTVGKVDVLEEGTIYYQLVKLPNSEDYNKFMKIAEQIANNKIEDNIYAKLEVANEFAVLYDKLVPEMLDANWIKVENNVVMQPEDAQNGEQYILWLKADDKKMDAQFLTCFADYKPEVISEKVVTKLPITADDPTLFIILAVLIVAFIVVIVIRVLSKTKEKESKH